MDFLKCGEFSFYLLLWEYDVCLPLFRAELESLVIKKIVDVGICLMVLFKKAQNSSVISA